MVQKGQIGVTTDNIFPIIKKFLYSDHEIFLREIVSNAVDATQKLKTLADVGEFKGELGDLSVRVTIDKKNKTLTVSDRGIGMSAEELDKYINQIALSSANDFLDKYKDNSNAIIGHFGLGFYSTFMVAKKVEIVTKSHNQEAPAVKWSCDSSPEYTMEEVKKEDRGTDIILLIDEENKEFLEKEKIESLLKKYCKFLPIPVVFGKKQEWKDGKYVDTEEDNVVNEVNPLWKQMPAGLKDEITSSSTAPYILCLSPTNHSSGSTSTWTTLQPDRHPLLPEDQEQPRPATQQDTTLQQPGLRHRLGRGDCTGIPHTAAWSD